jgi:hypothetical protein
MLEMEGRWVSPDLRRMEILVVDLARRRNGSGLKGLVGEPYRRLRWRALGSIQM